MDLSADMAKRCPPTPTYFFKFQTHTYYYVEQYMLNEDRQYGNLYHLLIPVLCCHPFKQGHILQYFWYFIPN